MFYDWSECVTMSVLGITKHSSCNQCIDTLSIKLYCIVAIKLYCIAETVQCKELKRTWCCACYWFSLCTPLVLGSEWWKNLAGFTSTRPWLILKSISRWVCHLRCSRFVYIRCVSMDVAAPVMSPCSCWSSTWQLSIVVSQ